MDEITAKLLGASLIISITMLGLAYLLATIATSPVNIGYVAVYFVFVVIAFYEAHRLIS
jgi:hypothetical protein